jgi:biopolymer transport protein ExbD
MRIPKARTGPVCDFDRTVTPMVDVVFQLLVFFVLASGGRVAEQSLSTVLAGGNVAAAVSAVPSKPDADHWIHLSRHAAQRRTQIELAGQTYAELSALPGALKQIAAGQSDHRVILDVAGDVPLGDVIFVYDACRAAKIHSINFAATPEEIAAIDPTKKSLSGKR